MDHTLTYHVDLFDFYGESSMPWGPSEETTLGQGDYIQIWVTALGNLNEGNPEVTATAIVNSVLDEGEEFGLHEPGFELTYCGEEEDGAPPFLYPVIPVGDAAYWSLLADLYEEAGYVVTDSGGSFTVVATFAVGHSFEIAWNKDTGVMNFFDMTFEDDGDVFILRLHLVSESTSPPDTATDESEEGAIPGFEAFFVVPMLIGLAIVLRRRRR